MRQQISLLFAIVMLALSAGCGSPASTGEEAIAEVVQQFLDGVRTADAETTNRLLTPKALEQTTAYDMEIAPPGSPTAKFEIGAIEIVKPDRAVAETVWRDVDPDGKPFEDNMTWALKMIDNEWRICGMAAEIGPDQEPIVLDFEDPTEILRLQKNRSAQQTPGETPLQATQPPQDPFRTVPR
jgi:hypothetical protein